MLRHMQSVSKFMTRCGEGRGRFIRGLWRRWSLILSAVAALAAAPGWAAEPLTLALSRSPLSLPFYVAEQQEYFAAEGVPIKIVEIIGGHRTMQYMLDGYADLATSSEAVVMFNSFKRTDFAVLASFVTSTEDVKLIVAADSGIRNAAQLADKWVGTIVGSASHYYLDSLVLLNGGDPKSVRVASLQPEAMAAALKNREVDAIAVWQPYAYRAEQEVAGARALPDDGAYKLSFNLAASRKVIAERRGELVKVLRALERAQTLIASEPGKAKAILRDRLQLDPNYADWVLARYKYRLSLDQSLVTTLESEARWARDEGHASATKLPNYLGLIHSAPLRQVRPSAVNIAE